MAKIDTLLAKMLSGEYIMKEFREADHPRADDGKFGSGSSSAASSRASRIISASASVPRKFIRAAKSLGKKAMAKIESRYGKGVAKAVSAMVIISLPLPIPGMSVLLSAPIIAAAELYRQFSKPTPELAKGDVDMKALVLEVITAIFGGRIPNGLKLNLKHLEA